jgi:RNA polymerase sigma factor (sigma-70 family)
MDPIMKLQHSPDDEGAQADLIAQYQPLVRKLVGMHVRKPEDYPDLMQAGAIGILKAAKNYMPARGRFGPYAKPYIAAEVRDTSVQLYARILGVPERQRKNGLIRHANGTGAYLESPLKDKDKGAATRARSKAKTLGDAIPDGQVIAGHSPAFQRQDTELDAREHRHQKYAERIEALVAAFDWAEDELGDRNIRIVLSHYRDAVTATLLDELKERRDLAPILTNRREEVLTDHRFETTKSAEAIGGKGAALVVTAVGEYPDGHVAHSLRQSAMRVWLKQQTRLKLSAAVAYWKKLKVQAATPRIAISWTWPYPQSVAGIAKATGLSTQAIYKILAQYKDALREVQADRKGK